MAFGAFGACDPKNVPQRIEGRPLSAQRIGCESWRKLGSRKSLSSDLARSPNGKGFVKALRVLKQCLLDKEKTQHSVILWKKH